MIHVGVDPGKQGAIVALNGLKVVGAWPMPMIRGDGRDEYDLPGIRDLFVSLRRERGQLAVTLEKGQPFPPLRADRAMGGSIANFQRGYGRGIFEGILVALAIPPWLVLPRTWQTVMLFGTSGSDTKQRSILAAQRLLPDLCLLRTARSRNYDSGISDAGLLALYGRRRGAESLSAPKVDRSRRTERAFKALEGRDVR